MVVLLVLVFFMNSVYALTANSSNYSISMFGTGMATATSSSNNYNASLLSEAKATTRNAESVVYTGNIGFFADTPYYRTVGITSYSISPASATIGSTISLYISALNAQSVWVIITRPDAIDTTLVLSNNGYTSYTPPIVGTYNVTFYANSSTGAVTSIIDSFELTEETTPPLPPEGGSGGTTVIIERCTYDWDCTAWSICEDKKQIRECKNTGTCEGNESKPREERVCPEALFDVTIKFADLLITENNTLKFTVNLKEQEGIENIDIQIQYSIIDEENNEIFSQIETRAIQGELTYEKEIEEVKLVNGGYILRIDILYGDLQRAFAEQSFEVKKGELEIKKFVYESLIIGILIFGFILTGGVFVMSTRGGEKKKGKKTIGYGKKIEKNLKRIGFKTHLIFFIGSIVIGSLFTARKNITGLVIGDATAGGGGWGIFGLVLVIGILGMLAFLYRKKAVGFIKEIKEKLKTTTYPKDSVKGLMKRKVYTEEGEHVGGVREVILKKNKIDSLKIKLGKSLKKKIKHKGIVIKYRNVKAAGHIIMIDGKILEHLNKPK